MQFLPHLRVVPNLHVLAVAFVLAGAATGRAQEGEAARVARWREDLGFLARELPARHKNLFFHLTKEEFEAAVAELDAAIPKLGDDEVVVELMRLVASVGDGHTSLQQGAAPVAWNRLPIRVRRFSDGLRIVAVGRDHRDALGGELVSVGGVAADEAWRRVSEVVSHENVAALDAFAPATFELPFVLHGLRLSPDSSHASFEVRSDGGATVALDLALTTSPADALGLQRVQPKGQAPLWQSHPGKTYWFEYVAASKLLFLQYNSCRDDPAQTFADFCADLWKCADENEVERVVVDLRLNGGGNSAVIAPLYMGLGSRRKLREKGRLFVAIGPSTFSSAMMNAIEMRAGYGAILVGAPTGGKPNAYGEVKSFELPKSRLAVQYSTKYFQQVEGDPPSVDPDVAALLSWSDWSGGRDPALEAILAWKPAAPKKE
jgi:hypothetical protein